MIDFIFSLILTTAHADNSCDVACADSENVSSKPSPDSQVSVPKCDQFAPSEEVGSVEKEHAGDSESTR